MRTAVLFVFIGLTLNAALAFPKYWVSKDLSTVNPGDTFGHMNIQKFESSVGGSKCEIRHTIPATGYKEGAEYEFTVSTDETGGLGMNFQVGSVKQNSDMSEKSEMKKKWTATSDTQVTAYAVCGSKTKGIMYVAKSIPVSIEVDEPAITGTWESLGCENYLPYNFTTGTGQGTTKREYEFSADKKWKLTEQIWFKDACSGDAPPIASKSEPFSFLDFDEHLGAYNIDMNTDSGKYHDIVMRLGDYLYTGAPRGGQDYISLKDVSKRPVSFSPAMKMKGSANQTPLANLTSIAGSWKSRCEYHPNVTSGKFFTREFTIKKEGKWSGKFTTYSDSECKNGEYIFNVPENTLTLVGAAKNLPLTVNAEFSMNGGKEYDIVSLVDGKLLLGARPIDGSGLTSTTKRPISFQPPLESFIPPEPQSPGPSPESGKSPTPSSIPASGVPSPESGGKSGGGSGPSPDGRNSSAVSPASIAGLDIFVAVAALLGLAFAAV